MFIVNNWYLILRCIVLREKELKKNKNRLALVKNAEPNKITIPLNTVLEMQGYCDKETQYLCLRTKADFVCVEF